MGTFIKFGIAAFITFCVLDYMNDNNLTLSEMFTTFPKSGTENTMIELEQKNDSNIQYNSNSEQKTINQISQSDEVIIRALGDVDESDLTDAAQIIKEFYGYNCTIGSSQPITDDLYISGTTEILNGQTCLEKFYTDKKVVYIVDKRLWAQGQFIRGFASTGGGFVIVRGEKSFLRETLIHEIGHTLGLGHCDDLSCIMAINNDQYDSGTFCNRCKNKIHNHLYN